MTVGAGRDPAAMPLLEHLRELRRRLIYVIAALGVGMILSTPLTFRVMVSLQDICPECQIQVIEPTEAIVTYFRVALVLGLVIATPVVLYQIVAFVSPGLHRSEKRMLYMMLPGAGLLFALGLLFGFYVALPRAVEFLSQFLGDVAAANWSLSSYVAFVMNMLLIIGLMFQTPLVVFTLARLNIVTPAFLRHYRRHAIVLMALIAAVLTPTPDPFTMLLVLAPMVILYEFGILLARIARPHR